MKKINKRWDIKQTYPNIEEKLSQKLNISQIVARLMVNRGIKDIDTARKFLDAGVQSLHDPFLMLDMDKAVEKIIKLIQHKEKITVYGDYDVDGITACSLLYKGFIDLEAVVEYYIPERQTEGYGLHDTALATMCETGTKLLVTVDCGISAIKEVSSMQGKLPIIITDHHEPASVLPKAYAILNPKRQGCTYPEKNLAGVGIAFKLLQALYLKLDKPIPHLFDYLDLVALGTVADIVSLTGENRALVKAGLIKLSKTKWIGLKALISACGLEGKSLDTGKIGFVLAPRLNAAGRLKSAEDAVKLLITNDLDEARKRADALNKDNEERQKICAEIEEQAEKMLEHDDVCSMKVIVLCDERWHSGVIGIVASRLVEKYYRPVIMISVTEGIGKGSCRSISSFNLYEALTRCKDLLIQFGGHKMAAGLSIDVKNIDQFRTRLAEIAEAELTAEDYQPLLNIDTILPLREVNEALIQQVACLEPYGMGNHSPVFACKNLKLSQVKAIGKGERHLKMKVRILNETRDVVAWNFGEYASELSTDIPINLAFVPQKHEYQNVQSVQLKALDFIMTESDEINLLFNAFNQGSVAIVNKAVLGEISNSTYFPTNIFVDHIFDFRNIPDKKQYIRKLLTNGEKTIIYVNHRSTAYQLAVALRDSFPDIGEQIGFYFEDMGQDWENKLVKWVQTGKINCVVSTVGFQENFQHVVLYNIPYTQNQLADFCFKEGVKPNLHLIYNKKDLQNCLDRFTESAPDRLIIKDVYLMLQSGYNNEIYWTDQEIATKIRTKFTKTYNVYTIAIAIDILEELGLFRQKWLNDKRVITKMPIPQSKLNLEDSKTYVLTHKRKKISAEFVKTMLSMPCHQLVQGGS